MFVFAKFSSLVLSKVLNRMIPPLMGIMNLFVYSLKATQFVHPAVGLIVWPVFLLIGWWFSFSIFYYESWSKMCDPELWRLSAWPGNWALLLARRLIHSNVDKHIEIVEFKNRNSPVFANRIRIENSNRVKIGFVNPTIQMYFQVLISTDQR